MTHVTMYCIFKAYSVASMASFGRVAPSHKPPRIVRFVSFRSRCLRTDKRKVIEEAWSVNSRLRCRDDACKSMQKPCEPLPCPCSRHRFRAQETSEDDFQESRRQGLEGLVLQRAFRLKTGPKVSKKPDSETCAAKHPVFFSSPKR